MSVAIAGAGYVGARLAEMLVADGSTPIGLKRDPSNLPPGVRGVAADVSDPATLRALSDAIHPDDPLHAVVYAVSPAGRSEDAYRAAYVDGVGNVLDFLRDHMPHPVRFILVSSTGVYGQDDGRWVDENTPPEPADATGSVILAGERAAADRDGGAVILRLGGIYGPGRTRTVASVLDGSAGCPAPDRYGNRIHRDDAAGAIRHLIGLADPAGTYIGVDRDPAPLRTVYRWIARRGGVTDPCAQDQGGTREGGSRRGTNKRCSSDRIGGSGYRFRYPTFREGHAPLVDELAG